MFLLDIFFLQCEETKHICPFNVAIQSQQRRYALRYHHYKYH